MRAGIRTRGPRRAKAATVGLLAGLLCLPVTVAAETLQAGSKLEGFSVEDQFGDTQTVDVSTRAILFTRDMDAGDLVKRALADDGAADLSNAGALYVSDVSGMPGLIRRIFAIPGMRKRPYPMGLDTDGSKTRDFPSREGHATLLRLDDLKVTEVQELASPEAVRAALAAAGNPTPESADPAKKPAR